jgi:hypothetical protein
MKTIICGVFLASLAQSVPAQSPSAEQTRQLFQRRLRGVTWISVFITPLSPADEAAGLSRAQLQTDVELRLRKVGVRVGSSGAASVRRGEVGILQITIIGLHNNRCGIASYVEVEFKRQAEIVSQMKDDAFTDPFTVWERGHIMTGPPQEVVRGVRESVVDMIDGFLNDYLAANPVKR